MDNSKLIKILKTFNTKERRSFYEFISSPYYNKNQELVQLYKYLRSVAPTFPLKKIQREKVYKAIFPKNAYDEKHLNYLMSFLLKLAEQYIGLTKYEQQHTLKAYHILSACNERQLDKNYHNLYKKAAQQLESQALRGADYYYQKYLMADLADQRYEIEHQRIFNAGLQEASDYLDLYFIAKKLQYTCEMLNLQKFLSVPYQQQLVTEVTTFLEQYPKEEAPVIRIYYQIYLMLTKAHNVPHFNQLKKLLYQYVNCFTPYEQKQMYLHAINFCIRKIRQKEEQYVQEALNLYLKGIEEKFLFDNHHLSPWTFKNIIKLGLRLGNYEWTEEIIKTHYQALHEEFRQNALNYSLADLYYHKQDVEQAMEYLREVEFSDIFFTLDAKVMLLKIYFDEDEEDALESLLISFKAFLKRNKLISNVVRVTYQNFINILSQILKHPLRLPPAIEQKIKETEFLTDRTWLIEVVRRT